MTKSKKLIIIIIAAAAAALIICFAVVPAATGFYIWEIGNVNTADVAVPDGVYTEAGELNGFFTDAEAYSNKNVSITGEIYTEPMIKEGMISFNIATAEGECAYINALDEEGKYSALKKGDNITIRGLASGSVKSAAQDGTQTEMPMIDIDEAVVN